MGYKEPLIMKGWAIMEVNEYSSAAIFTDRSANVQRKSSAPTESFSQVMKNTQTTAAKQTAKTDETSKIAAADEMETFKREIYNEISEIYSTASSALLSNSVHITDGAFEKMKNDPEFREKMMNILRQDSAATHLLPYKTCATTTITENGYSGYSAFVYPHDRAETKSAKEKAADKKAKDAFYYRKRRRQEIDNKIWLQNKEESAIQLTKTLYQKTQKQMIDEKYIHNYMLGIEQSKSWN